MRLEELIPVIATIAIIILLGLLMVNCASGTTYIDQDEQEERIKDWKKPQDWKQDLDKRHTNIRTLLT
jgi:hypothetical protein